MRKYLIFTALLFATPAAGQALQYPVPTEPAAKALVDRFAQEKAMMDAPDFLKVPATIPAWPCEVPETEQYKAAAMDSVHPVLRLQQEKELRANMRKMEVAIDEQFISGAKHQNVRIVPLKAACKDGKLDGEVEVLGLYDELQQTVTPMDLGGKVETLTNTTTSSHAQRLLRVYVDGKPTKAMRMASRIVVNMRTDSSNAKIANMGGNAPQTVWSYSYTDESENMGTFSVMQLPDIKPGLLAPSVRMVTGLSSMFFLTRDQHRKDEIAFTNRMLTTKGVLVDGQLHGEQISWTDNIYKTLKMKVTDQAGMEYAKEVVIDGKDMVENHTCYDHGVAIKTPVCSVQ